jgi:hypothetical protein
MKVNEKIRHVAPCYGHCLPILYCGEIPRFFSKVMRAGDREQAYSLELFLNKSSKLLDTDITEQHGFFLVFYKNIRVDP